MKTFAKYLVPLCVLLLSACGLLSALYKESALSSPVKNLKTSNVNRVDRDQFSFTNLPSNTKETEEFYIEEREEEDERVCYKKFDESGSYLALPHFNVSEYFLNCFNNRLPFSKFLSLTSSESLYITLGVLRI